MVSQTGLRLALLIEQDLPCCERCTRHWALSCSPQGTQDVNHYTVILRKASGQERCGPNEFSTRLDADRDGRRLFGMRSVEGALEDELSSSSATR